MTAAPGAAYFVVSGMTLNSALALIGGSERPGQTQFGPAPAPGQPPTQTMVSAGQRNVAAVYALDESRFVRLTTPVRQNTNSVTRDDVRPTMELVDIRTGSESVWAWPRRIPCRRCSAQTARTCLRKQMVVDANGHGLRDYSFRP